MIERRTNVQASVTIGTTAGGSSVIDLRGYAGAAFRLASGSTATVTVYGAASEAGTYVPLYALDADLAEVAMSLTSLSTGKGYELPSGCFAWPFLKLVGDAAGVADVVMKS